ncbi:MAG TPA: secretin and TonB N-terminal domain-containing protein [Opitutaceae bacterium]|nr:secretin and TonB N-terminal domain-containing protein [Opitutaceae bacterium]
MSLLNASLLIFPRRSSRAIRLVIACGALVSATLRAAEAPKRVFNVPADTAEKTLKVFSEQSGHSMVVGASTVKGVRTNPVAGEFTVRDALDRLLAGTGLVATHDEKGGAFTVTRESNGPNAQRAAPASSDRPNQNRSDGAAANAPVELSPFMVDASRDFGYLASNTLAGSRLNTSLKDTAATISVMTEEFLADIAAFSVSDALVYAGNLQIDQEEAVNGTVTGNLQAENFPTYRVRGLKASVARNYFVWNVPGNTYNIERIDESRGPNSILFGVGSAGGIINSSTKQATLGRPRQAFTFTAGSFDSYRATIDLNQPVLKDRLALRVNGLWSTRSTSRLYSEAKDRRVDLAALYQPFRDTQVRVEFERGLIRDHANRSWTLLDSVTFWNERNRPTRAAQTASAPDGIARLNATTQRITFIENSDRLVDLRGTLTTATGGAPRDEMIVDRRLVDYSVTPTGNGGQRDTRYTVYSAIVEQKLPGTTFLSLGFNHQDYNFVGHDLQQPGGYTLFGDPNQTMPTNATATQSNPYAGRYYIEANWFRRYRDEHFNTARAMLSNEFNLGKWGRYRWAGMAEYEQSNFVRSVSREFWDGRPFNTLPENAANFVWRRAYVTEGDWSTYRIPEALNHRIVSRPDPVSGRTLTSRWIQANQNIDDDGQKQMTFLVGGQASWFQHRLIGTVGYRRDRMKIEDRGTTRDAISNEIVVDYGTVSRSAETAATRTLGAVWHVTPSISLNYNESTNSALPNNAIRVIPGNKPEQGKGEGRDIGLGFDLFGGKVYFRGGYYTSAGRLETDFRGVDTIATQRNDRVLDALVAARAITAAEAAGRRLTATGGYTDRESDGWEARLVANPTPHWRLQANFSITDVIEDNILPEVRRWADENATYWNRFDTQIRTSTATIAQEIATMRDEIAAQIDAEGRGAIGNRRNKANVFTRYDFSTSWLRGVYVGGGYRYQGPMLVGRIASTGALQYTDSIRGTDALLGYRFRLPGNRGRGSVQLNIENVFDDTDPIILRYTAAGFVRRFSIVEPRTFRLSTSVQF